DAAPLELFPRTRQDSLAVAGQQLGRGVPPIRRGALPPPPAGRGQVAVEVLPALRLRDGDQEVAADVADAALDMALLVSLPHVAEVGGEGEVALQTQELPIEAALVWPGEAGHGGLAVVVADAAGHAAEEGAGADVALVKGFGAFAWEQAAEAGVAVRQGEDEQGRLVADTGHDHLGAAEVTLGFTRRMEQGDEDFGLGLL